MRWSLKGEGYIPRQDRQFWGNLERDFMSETNKTPTIFSDPFRVELEGIVERALKKALNGNGHQTELLTPEQLAEKLIVPLSWVYEQSRLGKIPTHKLGRYIRFDLHEVLASQKKD